MIDPFTAFAMAQGAVKGIKAAVQLGKDVSGLYKEFSQFYHAADQVHVASTRMRIAAVNKTDAQISSDALQIAMASKALRDNEKELKDILFWSGNADVWNEMMAERTRMAKERRAAEQAIIDQQQRDREAMYNILMNTLLAIGAVAVIVPVIAIVWTIVTR
ncbi:hypothetical protein [Haliscomenobacter sp.]|uniref:hypothetical protein n=1 Tax=Haliscomenobacter sp. TaxID=2717303 RepID=UPI003364E670